MITFAIFMLVAGGGADQTTLPRHPDPDPVEQGPKRDGTPTDPLFDRVQVATDDPAFIATALENSRQGVAEARAAQEKLQTAPLREAARQIGETNDSTTRSLEAIAKRKGWRLPEGNSQRTSSLAATTEARINASFIIGQLSWHEATITQYRAQIAGKGDPELKRALREALPRYEKNRDLLLKLKP
jgi:predicted outer membrane protein